MKIRIPLIATLSYIIFIVLLNTAMVYLPPVNIFSQPISPGDAFVGFIYIVRDFAQREIRHYVFFAMIIGAVLSFFLASHAIAVASISAFVVGEMVDWAVYTFTKRPLSKRLILSACLSAPLDTVIFLAVLHQLNWSGFSIMTLGKIIGVIILWTIWKVRSVTKPVSVISVSG